MLGTRASSPPATSPADGAVESQLGTTRLIERLDPAVVLALGDTQYRNGTIAEYLRSYDPTWGRFLSKTFPVPGNHEYNTPRAAGFFRYFGRRTFGGRGFYSFNRGGWHLVALDSVRGRRPDDRQLRWLRRDLAGNDARCELAFFHHPLFTSGLGAPASPHMAAFWRILFRQGVDVVLNGHAHSYERFVKLTPGGKRSPRGIREIVVGTGGIGLTNSATRSGAVRSGSGGSVSSPCDCFATPIAGGSWRPTGVRSIGAAPAASADAP